MNVYLLDYLNMIYLQAGYFETEADAQRWISNNAKYQSGWKVVTLDPANADGVLSPRKYTRYVNQR